MLSNSVSINSRFQSHLALYWTLALVCDYYHGVHFMQAIHVLPRVLSVQFLGVLPMMMLLEYMRTVCGGHVASWDSSIQIEHLVLAFGALLAGEWIVYIVHRAMHRNPTLAYFHQVHHQPLKSAAHALYASLGEVAILNVGAYALPLMLFGGHAKIIFLLETMGTVMAVLTHAGGSKGWAWSHGHDLHHRNPRYNFSTFLLADYVHGTFRSCSHVIAPKRVSTSIEELRKTFSEQRKRRKVVHQP